MFVQRSAAQILNILPNYLQEKQKAEAAIDFDNLPADLKDETFARQKMKLIQQIEGHMDETPHYH